jgi:hypothetical protein
MKDLTNKKIDSLILKRLNKFNGHFESEAMISYYVYPFNTSNQYNNVLNRLNILANNKKISRLKIRNPIDNKIVNMYGHVNLETQIG